jgi:hypothetical protein
MLMLTREAKLTRLLAAGYFSRRGGMRTWILLGAVLMGAAPAWAAPVRGTVLLPEDLKVGRRHQGYWRLENGILSAQPASNRGDTVVVLLGAKGQAPPARTITVEISGFQTINGQGAAQSTWVVGENSVIEFKNSDRVPHDLSIPGQADVMPVERLAPGQIRRQRFGNPGGYLVRCSEYPHVTASIIVMGSPFFAMVDEKGAFKLPDVPDGKAMLKVWSQGRWVHDEEIEVGPKSGDLRIKPTGGKTNKAPSE